MTQQNLLTAAIEPVPTFVEQLDAWRRGVADARTAGDRSATEAPATLDSYLKGYFFSESVDRPITTPTQIDAFSAGYADRKAGKTPNAPEAQEMRCFYYQGFREADDELNAAPAAVPAPELPADMVEFWGEPISTYSRAQAIEDGFLVDVTEWASREKGFHGGYTCPVAITRTLWNRIDVDAMPKSRRPFCQDTRGRAHDVLYMSSLAMRGALGRGDDRATFSVLMSRRKLRLLAVADGDGITIGFPECF